jgi:hypothetical protein
MLIPKPNIRIVSRPVILEGGIEALAYFAVLDVLGVLEVKFLGTKVLETRSRTKAPSEILFLDKPAEIIFGETPIRTIYEWLSPYFSLEFLQNQLARAPSIK